MYAPLQGRLPRLPQAYINDNIALAGLRVAGLDWLKVCRPPFSNSLAGGRLVVPQTIPCRSKAIGAVPLLKEDQLTSDVAGLEVEGEAVVVQCCLRHQAVMDNLRLGR
eukprot:9410888-Heterocapsa_arctica.AAC.1